MDYNLDVSRKKVETLLILNTFQLRLNYGPVNSLWRILWLVGSENLFDAKSHIDAGWINICGELVPEKGSEKGFTGREYVLDFVCQLE